MPSPQDMQLMRICSKPETLKRGKEIMRLAVVKTRPGSGYDLAMGASGLPPICAYIASQELNNGDITEKIAQSASCLNDKVFVRTLNLVRKAIADSSGPNIQVAMTYVTLVRSYTIGMVAKVVAWMEDTEKTLVQQAVLPAIYDVNSPLVKCAIFFWVCKICKISQVRMAYLIEDYHLPQKSFNSVLKLLTENCAPVAKSIGADVAVLRKALREKLFPTTPKASASVSTSTPAPAPMPPTSQTPVPAAASTSASVTNAVPAEPSSSAAALTQKRAANFDKPFANGSNDVSETPAKKRKIEASSSAKTTRSSTKKAQSLSAFEAVMSERTSPHKEASAVPDPILNPTPQPGPSTLIRRTSRSTRQKPIEIPDPEIDMDVDSIVPVNPSPSPPLPPRRFRPIFLDRQQWSLRDPRIEREWPAMQEHTRRMTNLYGHPFAAQVPDVEMLSL